MHQSTLIRTLFLLISVICYLLCYWSVTSSLCGLTNSRSTCVNEYSGGQTAATSGMLTHLHHLRTLLELVQQMAHEYRFMLFTNILRIILTGLKILIFYSPWLTYHRLGSSCLGRHRHYWIHIIWRCGRIM